jgi:hypothetical protein
MVGVTVLEVRGGGPRTAITAASATVRPDAQAEEAVVFEMKDCVLTRFDIEESGEARTLTSQSQRAIYTVRVAPDTEEILRHRKHLPLGALLRELRRLRSRLAGQPRLDDPQAFREERASERQRLNALVSELDAALDSAREKLIKYSEQEPRRLTHLIERNDQLVADTRAQLQMLQQRQAEVAARLTEAQDSAADLEHFVALQEQQGELLAQIERCTREIERLQAESAGNRQLAAEARDRAVELRSEVAEVERRRQELMVEVQHLSRLIGLADDRRELAAIRIRVHKRLAQAASVFIFALVGIPLGIMGSRRSVMVAFGISFAVVLLIFYPLLILGQMAAEAGRVPIVPAMWAGNVLTLVIGSVLTARVLST